jgi:transposase
MTSSLVNLAKTIFHRGETMKPQTKAQKFLSLLTAYFVRVKLFLDFLTLYKNFDGIIVALLIPKDHLLLRIGEKINFEFVNDLCQPYYKNSGPGRPPIAPVKIFKMLLVLVLYGLLSERELVRQVQVNVAFRHFCGFSLFDPIPEHSTFTVFRQRIGKATFKAIFVRVLELCIKHKLVTNEMYPAEAGRPW